MFQFILLCPVWVQSQDQPAVSNIVLITLDDLGQELGLMGDTVARTPFLDALATTSVNFKNAYATQSSCSPSRASILTGLYPFQHGQIGLANSNTSFQLKDHIIPLPRILSENGFYNAVIGKIHIKDQNRIGFDFMDGRTEKTREESHVLNALDAIYKQPRDKNFTMINLYDPHVNRDKNFPDQVNSIPDPIFEAKTVNPLPYQLVDDEEQLSRIASYYNAVTRADHLVDEVFSFFEDRSLLTETLFIILSDNGAPFNRGKTSNYESGIKTPFIIVEPNQKEGIEIEKFVSAIDIMPTILDYADLEIPKMLAGRSLKPLIKGKNWPDTPVFSEFHYHTATGFYPRKAVRYKNWKLIHNVNTTLKMPNRFVDSDQAGRLLQQEKYRGTLAREVMERYYNPPQYELYDLSVDPYELNDLSEDVGFTSNLERLKNMIKPQFPGSISRQFRNQEGTIIPIFEQYLIDSVWISPEYDHEQFEIFNRKRIKRLPLNRNDTIDNRRKSHYKIILNGKDGYGDLFKLEVNLTAMAIPSNSRLKYGPEARHFLDLHLASSMAPTPVYFDAHGNGGGISMPQSIVDDLNGLGISVISWESVPIVSSQGDVETAWKDAELMISWVKANAPSYNLDTINFLIGGSSRGSIISWKVAHNDPNVKGIYMYNALPDAVWNHPDWWTPAEEINSTSPPLFLLFEGEPGSANGHDPENGFLVSDLYNSVGIGHLDTLVHSIGSSKNTDKYQFLIDFVQKVINRSPVTLNPIQDIIILEDQPPLIIADVSKVFYDPEGTTLEYEITTDFGEQVLISIKNNYLEVTPTLNYNGHGFVRIIASDGDNYTELTFHLTVNPINDAPQFMLSQDDFVINQTSNETVVIEIIPDEVPTDELHQTVTYTISSDGQELATATINENEVFLTPIASKGGRQTFTVTANDGENQNNLHTESFHVSVDYVLSSEFSGTASNFYPNPVTGILYFKSDQPVDLQIFTLDGKIQLAKKVKESIDLSHLNDGLYIVKITFQGTAKTYRLIKTSQDLKSQY